MGWLQAIPLVGSVLDDLWVSGDEKLEAEAQMATATAQLGIAEANKEIAKAQADAAVTAAKSQQQMVLIVAGVAALGIVAFTVL